MDGHDSGPQLTVLKDEGPAYSQARFGPFPLRCRASQSMGDSDSGHVSQRSTSKVRMSPVETMIPEPPPQQPLTLLLPARTSGDADKNGKDITPHLPSTMCQPCAKCSGINLTLLAFFKEQWGYLMKVIPLIKKVDPESISVQMKSSYYCYYYLAMSHTLSDPG